MMTFTSEAFVFFPGGFGTFDELFSVLTLLQTGKIPRVPIYMIDSGFWRSLERLMQEKMISAYHTIAPSDMNLFEITDSLDVVIEGIRKSPVTEWWRNIN